MMHPHANAVLQQLLRDCELTSLLAEAERVGMEVRRNHLTGGAGSVHGTAEQWEQLKRAMYGRAQ